jgi:hypothetical protein
MEGDVRVLVCGGRAFDGAGDLSRYMDAMHAFSPITELIHGGATGADSLAGSWARHREIAVRVFPADWRKHGRAAGPRRNKQMLIEGKPDVVVAFPGGKGTDNMIAQAGLAGVRVVRAII